MKKVMGIESMGFVGGEKTNILPSFTINEKDLPEIKDWKVGSEYELSIKVKMSSFQKGDMYSTAKENVAKPATAKFEITEVEVDSTEDSAEGEVPGVPQQSAGMMKGETYGKAFARKMGKGQADKEMMKT